MKTFGESVQRKMKNEWKEGKKKNPRASHRPAAPLKVLRMRAAACEGTIQRRREGGRGMESEREGGSEKYKES